MFRRLCVSMLLIVGCGIKAMTTDLHRATERGHVEEVKALIMKGADVNAQDRNGCTILQLAMTLLNVAMIHVKHPH